MGFALLKEDQVFAQRYRVIRNIAAGGMGAVYEVEHTETERRCALKVMLPHVLLSEDLRERFKREARVTASLGSEFIVEIFDAGVDEETELPFLVMELLDGHDLAQVVQERGALPPAEVVTYLYQVALALRKTHAASIVHRDLKPENLVLTHRDDGSPKMKVLDFGISKVVADSSTRNQTLTIGTPLYMSPEQFLGNVMPATDVFALGMIAYSLLVGHPYWRDEDEEANSSFALSSMLMHGPSEAASVRAARMGTQLPEAFDAWFRRVTAKQASERPSALEAIESLASVFTVQLPAARSFMPSFVEATTNTELPRTDTGHTKSPSTGANPIVERATTLGATSGENLKRSIPPKRSMRTAIGLGVGLVVFASSIAAALILRPARTVADSAAAVSSEHPAALVPQAPVSLGASPTAAPLASASAAATDVADAGSSKPAATAAPKGGARTEPKKNAPAAQDKKSVYSRM